MHAQVVGRRIRAVVTAPLAAHVGVAREPAGVIVQALARTGRPRRRLLAVRGDAVAATAGCDRMHARGNVDHHPMHEVRARLFDGDLHVVAADRARIGRRIGVDAQQHERLRVRRRVRSHARCGLRLPPNPSGVPIANSAGMRPAVRETLAAQMRMSKTPFVRPGPAMVPWTGSIALSSRSATQRSAKPSPRQFSRKPQWPPCAAISRRACRRQRAARGSRRPGSPDRRPTSGCSRARAGARGGRRRSNSRRSNCRASRTACGARPSTASAGACAGRARLSSKSCCCGNSLRLRASEPRHLRSKYHMYSGRPRSIAVHRARRIEHRAHRRDVRERNAGVLRAQRDAQREVAAERIARRPPSGAWRSGARLRPPRATTSSMRLEWNRPSLRWCVSPWSRKLSRNTSKPRASRRAAVSCM